jgi:Rnl2 family RNA ligase
MAYPKIPTAARSAGPVIGGPWTATEKVHGGQLVVGFDGVRVRVGKRKAWLAADEPFFGWQLLRDRFERAALAALDGAAAVRIYGEVYGGGYPHPAVPAVPGTSAVQTGVWYAPDIRFALFDVLRQAASGDPGTFLTYAEVAAIAGAAGLDVVPLLCRGTRQAVDEVPVRFPTRVPALSGLPEIEGNLAEGVVLRPDAPLPPGQRPIVKRKIPEFDEVRFGLSRPWDPAVRLTVDDLRAIARTMVNGARLASARSKVGCSAADALLDEVALDVMIDLAEAYPVAMATLRAGDEAALQAHIRDLGRPLVPSARPVG